MKWALACPNVEFAGAADVYTGRLEEAKAIAPGIKTYLDHRYLLEDQSLDAVIIATPQHLHARHFVDSLQAGKHVYQEKTMAFQVDHAKQMRAAYRKASGRCRPDRPPMDVRPGHGGCPPVSGRTADGADHRHPHGDVPKHAARPTAMVSPGKTRASRRKT